MAIAKKYKEQMPFVGTETMKRCLDDEADRRRTSIARIIRDLLDEHYLLHDGDALTLADQAELAEQIAQRARRRADDLAVRQAAAEHDQAGEEEQTAGRAVPVPGAEGPA